MPQFIAIAAIGAGLFAGARWARRELARLEAKRQQTDLAQRSGEARSVGSLKEDPKSGIYRPN